MPSTILINKLITGLYGVLYIRSLDLQEYIEKFKPVVLKYGKRNKSLDNLYTLNFGKSKGLNFERVLILVNEQIQNFLKGDYLAISSPKSKAGLHVVITRAKYTVLRS
jgi:DNA helicase II / ATP-dependent DNA helicase PcrA